MFTIENIKDFQSNPTIKRNPRVGDISVTSSLLLRVCHVMDITKNQLQY